MDPFLTRQILALFGSLILAVTAYRLVRSINFERGASVRVQGMVDTDPRSMVDRYGESLADRLGLSLTSLQKNLELAKLDHAKYLNWTTGGLLFRCLLYGSGAVLGVLVSHPGPIFWITVPLAAYLPIMQVKGAADDTRKAINRLLPETATVIAAEMAAGANPDQALGRAAELPGPLGILLKRAVAESMQSKRPAFSRGTARGVVVEILSRQNLPALTRFAMQLDRVATKGVEGPRIMAEVARGLAREYKAQVQTAAAALDNELLIPMTAFFFFPFMVAILLPLLMSLFASF